MIKNTTLTIGLAMLCVVLATLLLLPQKKIPLKQIPVEENMVDVIDYGELYDEFFPIQCLWLGSGLDDDMRARAIEQEFLVEQPSVSGAAVVQTCRIDDGRHIQILQPPVQEGNDKPATDEYLFWYETADGKTETLGFSGLSSGELAGPHCRITEVLPEKGEVWESAIRPRHVIIECRVGDYLATNTVVYVVDLLSSSLKQIATCVEETNVIELDEDHVEYYLEETACL